MAHLHSDFLYLVKGVNSDRRAWYYILIDDGKSDSFLKALNNDSIHLEDYGKILYSAYGEEPPVSITEQVKKDCGIH